MVFFLHDTHGFPWDLTQVIARERGFDIDLPGYERLMETEREKASFGGSGDQAVADLWSQLRARLGKDTEFLGYEAAGDDGDGRLLALVIRGPGGAAGDGAGERWRW